LVVDTALAEVLEEANKCPGVEYVVALPDGRFALPSDAHLITSNSLGGMEDNGSDDDGSEDEPDASSNDCLD